MLVVVVVLLLQQLLLPLLLFQKGYGAAVARLTPDQKVACSNHVGLRFFDGFLMFF